jgi:hypothetical protein
MKPTGPDQNRLPQENGYDLLCLSPAIALKSTGNYLSANPNTPHPFAQPAAATRSGPIPKRRSRPLATHRGRVAKKKNA